MSSIRTTPQKRNASKRNISTCLSEDNNNSAKYSERLQARNFVSWFRSLIDNERQNFILYLADNVTLEWFGRTIRSRKKVAAFLKYDMHCSRHDFRTVECIDAIQTRCDRNSRRSILSDTSSLASPLHSPELIKAGGKRQNRSRCLSPEWANTSSPERKRVKGLPEASKSDLQAEHIRSLEPDDITNKGDGMRQFKRKCLLVTPPNKEVGQGDCLPSTSDNAIIQAYPSPPKKAVECNGFVEFVRTRNSRSIDAVKWERKCKVQISYSHDPVNVGEYILWAIHYTDETKCRRNLLPAFEEVALEAHNNS